MTTATDMLKGSSFNRTNYDLLLVAWEAQTEPTGITFHAGDAEYTPGGAAESARTTLATTSTWSITDGGPALQASMTGSGLVTADLTKTP